MKAFWFTIVFFLFSNPPVDFCIRGMLKWSINGDGIFLVKFIFLYCFFFLSKAEAVLISANLVPVFWFADPWFVCIRVGCMT
jgi:hypothetical protein